MPMLDAISLLVVVVSGVYFVSLGLICLFRPALARTFLFGFASSATKHYLEMALRLLVGASLLLQAPHLEFSTAITVFGWLLIGTTAVLLLMPWKWHQRFAQRVLPDLVRYLALIGTVSVLLGAAILYLAAGQIRLSGQ